jgi:hypothetical protein
MIGKFDQKHAHTWFASVTRKSGRVYSANTPKHTSMAAL